MTRKSHRSLRSLKLKTIVWSIAVIGAVGAPIVLAQGPTVIKTDASWSRTPGTLSPSASATTVTGNLGTVYSVPGKLFTIAESAGKRAGTNLFHSFETFSVGAGDAAVFTTQTASLTNVISRVSGLSSSSIQGLLLLKPAAGSKPNFFLINPNGITFGAGAQIDVPAAFHASTARELRFGDGTVFKAGNGSDSTLSIAAPQAFGFLGGEAAVTIKDVLDVEFVTSFLDLSGGSVGVANSAISVSPPSDGDAVAMRFVAAGPHAASIAVDQELTQTSSGSVHFEDASLSASDGSMISAIAGGTIDASLITISAGGAPERPLIGIHGSSIAIDSTVIWAATFGGPAAPARHIEISGGSVTIDNSTIQASPYTPPTPGGGATLSIDISATDTLDISRSTIWTAASDISAGGAINLSSQGAMHLAGDETNTPYHIETFGFGASKGGDITIRAHDLQIDFLDIATYNDVGTGDAGRVQIDVTDHMNVANRAVIRSFNNSPAASSGAIEINAARVGLDYGLIEQQAAAASSGQLGDIRVNASVSLTSSLPGIFLRYDSAFTDVASLKPAALSINAPSLEVTGRGRIGVASLSDAPPTHVLLNGNPYVENSATSPIQFDTSWGHSARGLPWTYSALLPGAAHIQFTGNRADMPARAVDGSVYVIDQNEGRLAGTNLFYSFDRLSLEPNDALLFTTTTPSLQNIISRVSGSSASHIEGLLLVRAAPGSHPNFFLINPAGIAFSNYTQIDVPGAFHVSTAHTLRFSDNSGFDAGAGPNAQISGAQPAALEFSLSQGTLSFGNLGGPAVSGDNLSPIVTAYFDATATSISAGYADLNIVTPSPSFATGLRLHATGSEVVTIPLRGVPATGGAGDIDFGTAEVDGAFSVTKITKQDGPFRLPFIGAMHASTIIMSSWDELQTEPLIGIYGDSIHIAGRSFETRLSGDPAHVDAAARQITFSGGAISLIDISIASYLDAEIGGRGADISIRAQTLSVLNSHIHSEAGFSGTGGSIKIAADQGMKLLVGQGALGALGIDTVARGSGTAGDIKVDAQQLIDGVSIASSTDQSASADSGRVHVGVGGNLTMIDHGTITSTTASPTGRAAAIDVSGGRIIVGGGGIVQEASAGSSGLTDGITVTARDELSVTSRGVRVSNNATVADPSAFQRSSVSIVTPNLDFQEGRIGFVSKGNVPAGEVTLNGQPFSGGPTSPIEIDGSWGRTAHDLVWSRSAEAEGEPMQITGRGLAFPYRDPQGHYVHVITGNLYTIAEGDGKLAGDNLFYSFGRFSIPSGDAALFTTVTPTLHNVIARVTGSSPSSIEGLLMLDSAPGSKPNLFLINPAGVTITNGAEVDVPAAMHLSTATQLKFADGIAFTAGHGADSTFTAAAPTAFGFTGAEGNAAFLGLLAGDDGDVPMRSALGIRFVASLLDIEAHDIGFDSTVLTLSNGALRFIAVGDQPAMVNLDGKAGADVAGSFQVALSAIKDSYLNNDITIAAGDVTMSDSQVRNMFDITLPPRDTSTHMAGAIDISAHSVVLDNTLLTSRTNGWGPHAGKLTIDASSSITLLNGTQVTSDVGLGAPDTLHLRAPDIILTNSSVESRGTGASDQPPNVIVDAERLTMVSSGIAQNSQTQELSPATITINAGFLTMTASGIGFGVHLGDENLGNTRIFVAHELHMLNSSLGAGIGEGSGGFGGKSGNVTVSAPSIILDGSSISSDTSAGGAGEVKVSADTISILNGGSISTSTSFEADAGSIEVIAKSISLDGRDSTAGQSSRIEAASISRRAGLAGNIRVVADSLSVTNGARISVESASVPDNGDRTNPGNLSIFVPEIKLAGGGRITAETTGSVSAKEVVIKAHEDGHGSLRIVGDGTGEISTSTALPDNPNGGGGGKAGDILLKADSLTLSGVSVFSDAKSGTTGAAGKITIDVPGDVSILNGTRVATDTFGAGAAGNIKIAAGTLFVDPSEISSRAADGSSGQPGSIDVSATQRVTITDASRLTIQNDVRSDTPGNIHPVSITVAAPEIDLTGSDITAASSKNIAAGNIRIDAGDQLIMRQAGMLTTAQDGNGGSIQVSAGRLMMLDHSQITTSVAGQSGNGGDIGVTAQLLVMNTGFVQANTVAPQASGGNVSVNVSSLVASGTVLLNGLTPLAFDPSLNGINVFQAAAREGVSGNVRVTAPAFDVSGSLRGLSTELITFGALGKDLCRAGAGSSLTPLGRGGLRPTSAGLMRPETNSVLELGALRTDERAAGAVSAREGYAQRVGYRCENN